MNTEKVTRTTLVSETYMVNNEIDTENKYAINAKLKSESNTLTIQECSVINKENGVTVATCDGNKYNLNIHFFNTDNIVEITETINNFIEDIQ